MDDKIGAAYLDEAFRSLRGHMRLAEGAFSRSTTSSSFMFSIRRRTAWPSS